MHFALYQTLYRNGSKMPLSKRKNKKSRKAALTCLLPFCAAGVFSIRRGHHDHLAFIDK